MLERAGLRRRRSSVTGELDRALDGADFVLVQIRVGGQAARLSDETVPLACGCIGQETTGAGGFAKALRTVPVVLEIAERVRELASPDAWIVDFTNPVGIVTRSLLDAGHRAVGLCNVAIGFQRSFATHLGVEPARGRRRPGRPQPPDLDPRRARRRRDVLPELMASHGDAVAEQARAAAAAARGARRRPLLLPALLLPPRRGARRAARRRAARGDRRRDRARPARALPRPGAEREAGAARAARRRVLQRGRDRARRARSSATTASSTRSTSGTTARSPGSRTTTSSRCRRGSRTGGSCRCRRRRSRRSCSGSPSTSPRTSGSPRRRR